ncbi:CLUMA_CG004922, isoform A [Clunio marinus]|uniref:E3 ubiquitin-protein ligase ZNRF1 n=1 Tax=Clunio marinus TaxID=568069 RepID=A0A1J1HT52_9DIPT|nr:CLUMA_CG004922, isoform A [Clunio marinus]
MGAKASTNGNQSPRTFSNSSSSDVVSAGNNSTSFNFLRAIHGAEMANDSRQRARSMSSVPDIQSTGTNHHHHSNAYSNYSSHTPQQYSLDVNNFQNSGDAGSPHFELSSANPDEGINQEDNNPMLQGINALGLGRVYTAASLPSHIWSINGFKCPVCSKCILPDDIECHIVMCLTKPRLSYNEDVLSDPKGECVICLEDLITGDVIARLPCLCIYHKGCIDKWFEVNRSCPEHPSD